MLGTIVNTLAIIMGALLGTSLKGGIAERYQQSITHAVAFCVLLIGAQGALKGQPPLLIIFSMTLGTLAGELLGIEEGLAALGRFLEKKANAGPDNHISQGFVAASLLFCVGSMAIVGSLESGLTGNHQTLFAKSALDGIISIVLAASYGWSVAISAVSVFCYQGLITLMSTLMKPFLTAQVIAQMSAIGGLLIAAIAVDMLGLKKLRLGSMLPAIFMPFIFYAARLVWRSLAAN